MATFTTKFNLEKPALDEYYDIAKFNSNSDKIDAAAKLDENEEITGIWKFGNTGLTLADTDDSHILTIKPGSNLTTDRILTITTGDADRTLTLSTDITLDQAIAVASSPTFAGLTLSGLSDGIVRASSGILAGAGSVDISSETNLAVSNPISLTGDTVGLKYDALDFQLDGSGNLQVKDSGIDHGSLAGLGDDDHTQYLLAAGTRVLSGNWDIGDTRQILADVIRARDGDGLSLFDDAGNGIFITDGGNVLITETLFLENNTKQALTQNSGTLTLYVDAATGDDGNPGTSASPKKTIMGAVNALPRIITQATKIYINSGTYSCDTDGSITFDGIECLSNLTIEARDLSDNQLYVADTIATGGGVDTITKTGSTWGVNVLTGGKVWIRYGTGAGQIRDIASNTADTITVSSNWTTPPDNTSYFCVASPVVISSSVAATANFTLNAQKNIYIYGFQLTHSAYYVLLERACLNCNIQYNWVDGYLGIYLAGGTQLSVSWNFYSIRNTTGSGIVLYNAVSTFLYGNVYVAESSGYGTAISVSLPAFPIFNNTAASQSLIKDCAYGLQTLYYMFARSVDGITFDNVTVPIIYSLMNANKLDVLSYNTQPYIKLTNNSDTARDPIISFAVGASPVTKFTLGVDDSDSDIFKIDTTALGTTNMFTINANGIGIGTATQSAKFAVNGGVHVGGDSDPGDNNLLVDGNGVFSGTLDWSANPALPKIYSQSTEPDIANNSVAFWKDTDDSKFYLILDIAGTQKKIELV